MQQTMAASVFLLSSIGAGQTPVSKALQPFQGTWVLTATSGTLPVAPGAHVTFTVTGNKYEATTNGKTDERGTVTLGAEAKLTTIDLAIAEGSHAGKNQIGIVEVRGDATRLALAEPGDTIRPANFAPLNGCTASVMAIPSESAENECASRICICPW